MSRERQFYVYIMCNSNNETLYTGMTNAIHRRVAEHKQKIVPGFTKKYSCTKLVHVEVFATAYDAIAREKQIKGGSRRKKIALVMKDNLAWKDLTDEI